MRCTLEFSRQSNTAAAVTLVELAQSARNERCGNAICLSKLGTDYSEESPRCARLVTSEMSLCLFDDINWSRLRIEITQVDFDNGSAWLADARYSMFFERRIFS